MPGKVDLTDLDMWARAVPYDGFARLRREAPVAWFPGEGGFWSVARYADIMAASRDVPTFSSGRGVSFEDPTDTRGTFPGPDGVADLDEALAAVPAQVARGFTTICVKPSQFLDETAGMGAFCQVLAEKAAAL